VNEERKLLSDLLLALNSAFHSQGWDPQDLIEVRKAQEFLWPPKKPELKIEDPKNFGFFYSSTYPYLFMAEIIEEKELVDMAGTEVVLESGEHRHSSRVAFRTTAKAAEVILKDLLDLKFKKESKMADVSYEMDKKLTEILNDYRINLTAEDLKK